MKYLSFAASVALLAGCATPPLQRAVMEGNLDAARALLEQGMDVNGTRPPNGTTALSKAAERGDVAMMRLLLDHHAAVDRGATPCLNCTALSPMAWAALRGQDPAVELLLEHGANPDVAEHGLTAWGNTSFGIMDETAERLASAKVAIGRIRRAQERLEKKAAKEELSNIVQAAVEKTVKAQGKPAAVPFGKSDVDKPAYRFAERPDDFALVVGIEKYSDIPEAQFAQNDAEAVKDHLIALGFPSRNVVQLFGEKAGRSSMEKFLENWLPRNVKEDSRVFFYFSGHGAPDPKTGEAYLIPWDGDPTFLENTGYPLKRLYEKLSALKAKETIVALDACFSGAGGRSVLAKGARPLVTKMSASTVPSELTVFAAASSDQITSTLEDQGHGTFTYYFLKGLGGAAKGDSGAVTAKNLYDYLKPKVQDAARRQNRDQQPVLSGSSDQELVRFP